MFPSPFCSSDKPPLVTLDRAEKCYGSRVVLRMERLELHRYECLLIVGPNGSGKSTLLRLLAGVTTLSRGRTTRTQEYDTMRICYVPQAGGLYQNLTVADNIRLWNRLLGTSEPENLTAQWYIRGFGLARYLRSRCRELSGGYQRLAAIACALATQPNGLFLDEPLNGIDAVHGSVLLEGITAARNDLDFIVMTSHSAEGFGMASRVVILPGSDAA
jgi:ABC-type multidrug transport system ATPase subunit